jgi:hypothetical protein
MSESAPSKSTLSEIPACHRSVVFGNGMCRDTQGSAWLTRHRRSTTSTRQIPAFQSPATVMPSMTIALRHHGFGDNPLWLSPCRPAGILQAGERCCKNQTVGHCRSSNREPDHAPATNLLDVRQLDQKNSPGRPTKTPVGVRISIPRVPVLDLDRAFHRPDRLPRNNSRYHVVQKRGT